MLATVLLLAAPALPPVIADPRFGASRWVFVRAPAAPPGAVVQWRGAALVAAASDSAQAVAALAAGASAVLIGEPDTAWEDELAGLLPEPQAARGAGGEVPTALRGADLATVVGLPRGFAGGDVALPSSWDGRARHQRAAARQEQLVPQWRADQRLLVRVWVEQLARSFEVALAGAAFWEGGGGTGWGVGGAAVGRGSR